MPGVARQSVDRFLLQAVDAGLMGVIFVAPLAMGGRHPWGQLLLAILAAAMGLAWGGHLCCRENATWRPTWAALLWLAGAGLTLLQITPLPDAALHWLAPQGAALLPLWNQAAGLGTWRCVSLTPADTRTGLAIFLAYGMIFFVAAERIRTVEDVECLLRWCALSAVGMAGFGLVQFFGGNGKFFWFYEHPYSGTSVNVNGSFTNHNHFAHFLALGLGPLVWWLQDAVRRMRMPGTLTPCPSPARREESFGPSLGRRGETVRTPSREMTTYLLGLSLGIVLFAGLLSLSRGGAIAMAAAAAISTAVCYQTALRTNRLIAALTGVGLLIGVSLAVFGYDRVADRLHSLSAGSLEKLDGGRGRRMIWAATVKSIPRHLPIGAGAGSFTEVYPVYADTGIKEGVEFTHGENCYLPVTLETGAVGLALIVAGIATCGWWCRRGLARGVSARLRLCAGAITASLAASVVHGAVDSVWYVPACVAVVAVLAACSLRVGQLADGRAAADRSVPLPKPLPAMVCATTLLLGGWMATSLTPPALAAPYWDRYRRELIVMEKETAVAERSGNDLPPGGDLRRLQAEEKLIADLERVVYWQPSHARAHLELADSHLRLFEKLQQTAPNPMSLLNIRDAVQQSQFPSHEAMLEWLSRAVGGHWMHLDRALRHTRQALALCPLHGRGYIYLAELSFLEQGPRPAAAAYVEQALRVRPFDSTVLYGAGSEAYLAGDPAKWLEYAKQAFHSSYRQQRQLTADMVGRTTADELPVLIEFIVREFAPDRQALQWLHAICEKRCPPDRLTPLVRQWAGQSESEARRLGNSEAATVWLDALRLRRRLGDDAEALQCARNAVQCDPNSRDAHYQLALCLLKQQSFADAESHLQWCLQRTPGDREVQMRFREALKGRLDTQRSAAVDGDRSVTR